MTSVALQDRAVAREPTLLSPSQRLTIRFLPSQRFTCSSLSLASVSFFVLFLLFQPKGRSETPLYIETSDRGAPSPCAYSFARAAATLPGRDVGAADWSEAHTGESANDIAKFMLTGGAMIMESCQRVRNVGDKTTSGIK